MHTPTAFLFIILQCVLLATTAGLTAGKDDGDGLRTWSRALFANAIAFTLFAARGEIPDALSIIAANGLVSAAFGLFLLALYRFFGLAVRWHLVVGPPLLLMAAFLPLMDDIASRVFVSNTVFATQAAILAVVLIRTRVDFPTRGRTVLIACVFVTQTLSAIRALAALFAPELIDGVFKESVIQTMSYVGSFSNLLLVSTGFMMMAKERAAEGLRLTAMKDKLTGCWNRIRIEDVARQEMARLERYSHPVSMIVVDLDHFKLINDQHGHSAGDTILKGFAEIARQSLRATDVLGRWGGEEFLILLPATGFPEAVRIAERLRASLACHTFANGLRVTASLGISVCRSGDTWDDWLDRADVALYRAKAAGRDRVMVEGMEIDPADLVNESAPILQLLWRDEYALGHPLIDTQHKALFERANMVLRAGADNLPRERVTPIMRQLLKDVRIHMAAEVRLLAEYGFDDAPGHTDGHDRLLHRADHIMALYDSGRIGNGELIHFVVYELIAQHVLLEDRAFRDRFTETRAAAEPRIDA